MAYVAICILCALMLLLLITSSISNINNFSNKLNMKIFTLALNSNLNNENKQFNNLYLNTKNISLFNKNISKGEETGLLNIITTVDNKNKGNKTPSDFTIIVHANDPYPTSFAGNSSGTQVKLGMGMYSISESIVPEYHVSFSKDCFGGIMSTIVKNCTIKNTYTSEHQ